MNWFEEGLVECGRKTARLAWRAQLALAQRRLARAETALGELGWQQADFPDSMQDAVKNVDAAERRQALLFNRSAEIAAQIGERENERAENRRSLEEALGPLRAERAPVAAAHEELTRRLKAHEATLPEIEKQLARLTLEAQTLSKLNEDLLASEPAPADFLLQRGKLADYRSAITNDREEAERNRLHARNEIAAMKQELFKADDRLAAIDERVAAVQREFDAAERRLLGEIEQSRREKADVEKTINALDAEKSAPFRMIGQCLADNDIGPRNQPEALAEVKARRVAAQSLAHRIADSRQRSDAREDPDSFGLTVLTLGVSAASGIFWLCVAG